MKMNECKSETLRILLGAFAKVLAVHISAKKIFGQHVLEKFTGRSREPVVGERGNWNMPPVCLALLIVRQRNP